MEKSFFDKCAVDLMQRDIITIRPQDTLDDALTLMTENHVTGLPVMDHHSKCVGVVTANDILNCQRELEEVDSETNVQFFDVDSQQWQSLPVMSFRTEKLKDTRVEEVMARDLIRVDLDATVTSVARTMLDAGVHRVLVLDEHNRLYGIVSALDFVRMIAE
jgi:CBS domain-containing protein